MILPLSQSGRNWAGRELYRFCAKSEVEIEKLIKEDFPDAIMSIEDLRGDGDHYAATIISEAFAGKTRVKQHQLVSSSLKGRMGNELHALALQTSAPNKA